MKKMLTMYQFWISFLGFPALLTLILLKLVLTLQSLNAELKLVKTKFSILDSELKVALASQIDTTQLVDVFTHIAAKDQTQIQILTTAAIILTASILILAGLVYFGGGNTGPGTGGVNILPIDPPVIKETIEPVFSSALNTLTPTTEPTHFSEIFEYPIENIGVLYVAKLGDFGSAYYYGSYRWQTISGDPNAIICLTKEVDARIVHCLDYYLSIEEKLKALKVVKTLNLD